MGVPLSVSRNGGGVVAWYSNSMYFNGSIPLLVTTQLAMVVEFTHLQQYEVQFNVSTIFSKNLATCSPYDNCMSYIFL